MEQGGPWGFRHQFNIADSGYGSRGPRVHNDRAGEVGRTLNVKDFDLDRLFGKEGVQILPRFRLIGALSPETSNFCLELARAAKKHKTRISFDPGITGHHSGKTGKKKLRAIFTDIAGISDILVGNEEDFQLCLGIKGPEAAAKPCLPDRQLQGDDRKSEEKLSRSIGVRYHTQAGYKHQ